MYKSPLLLLIFIVSLLWLTACSETETKESQDHTYDGTWRASEIHVHDSGRISFILSGLPFPGAEDTSLTLINLDTTFDPITLSTTILDIVGDSLFQWSNEGDTTFKVSSSITDWTRGAQIDSLEQIASILPKDSTITYTSAKTIADNKRSHITRELKGTSLIFSANQYYTLVINFLYNGIPGEMQYQALRTIEYTTQAYEGPLQPKGWPTLVDTLTYDAYFARMLPN